MAIPARQSLNTTYIPHLFEALSDELVSTFTSFATAFKSSMVSHVLRRDRREDAEYRRYFEAYGDYRNVTDISVSPETHAECFTRDRLRRFCAAEALSMLPQDNARIKRMRLSVAPGHSLDAGASQLASENSVEENAEPPLPEGADAASNESSATAGFWLDRLGKTAPNIYDHPALLAVIREIEGFAARGEKILVFGRYIRPLQALTRHLDARAMLQALVSGGSWPGQTIEKDAEQGVHAALRDPAFAERYHARRRDRTKTLLDLRADIDQRAATGEENAALLARILAQEDAEGEKGFDSAHLYEALEARHVTSDEEWTGESALVAFKAILDDLARGDETEPPLEETLLDRLRGYLDDYSGRDGSFARLMCGATGSQARPNLQSAFNRRLSNPRILLAQSRVGREGLNLHEECRRVILLYAEWNPAIVEQQIGRLDRKNSRWLKDHRASVTDNGAPARIYIHPIVIGGTYDDHNWQVLKARWTGLRVQLNGEVLPAARQRAEGNPELQAMIDRVVAATPTFSPLRQEESQESAHSCAASADHNDIVIHALRSFLIEADRQFTQGQCQEIRVMDRLGQGAG